MSFNKRMLNENVVTMKVADMFNASMSLLIREWHNTAVLNFVHIILLR